MAVIALYASTIFVSAFLLFQVQPIIGKMILPWFGGSASVWTTCLLFFQALLLAGYLYAHAIVRYLSPRQQSLVHIALLIASIAVLPIGLADSWKPTGNEDPTGRILGLLGASVGLPYLLLSTTGPLLQAWFARERPGTVPYRLFALSNFGSMLGLLGYPFLVEPYLPLQMQGGTWSAIYCIFVVLCVTLAWRGRSPQVTSILSTREQHPAPNASTMVLWILLATCPSVLLMAITSHLTTNVAPIPLLWVVPLALYLLSFILCFESDRWYRRVIWIPLMVAGFAAIATAQLTKLESFGPIVSVPVFVGAAFAAFMVCHGELSKLKPHPVHLTTYFVMISVGGALGGLFVGVIAPRVFHAEFEMAIGMVATVLLLIIVLRHTWAGQGGAPARALTVLLAAIVGGLSYQFYTQFDDLLRDARMVARNFYGTLRVSDNGSGDTAERVLYHGTIIHGEQYTAKERLRWPTTYYGEKTGVGIAIKQSRGPNEQRVGVVGLGAGTLAAYARPGDYYRIYEINPLVIDIAQNQFSFLRDTGTKYDLVLGDARLSLEREKPNEFDVLAVDAFSGDAIPVHLLTIEAFTLYFRHLKPHGVLAIHVSNRFLELAPIVKAAADRLKKKTVLVDSDEDDDKGVFGSTWVLVGDPDAKFFSMDLGADAKPVDSKRQVRMWTDDYSSIYSILKDKF